MIEITIPHSLSFREMQAMLAIMMFWFLHEDYPWDNVPLHLVLNTVAGRVTVQGSGQGVEALKAATLLTCCCHEEENRNNRDSCSLVFRGRHRRSSTA
jgi:hypothetical protein